MSINRKENGSDLDRSSWEGMADFEIGHKATSLIFSIQKRFLENTSLLDLEEAAIDIVSNMDNSGKESAISVLNEVKNIGIRGCLEKLIPNSELIDIEKEETKRLIDFLKYSESTPG